MIRLSRELSAAELVKAAERRSEPAPKTPVSDQPRVPTGSCAVPKVKLPPMVPTVTGKPTEPSTKTKEKPVPDAIPPTGEPTRKRKIPATPVPAIRKTAPLKRRGKARNVSALLNQKESPPKPNQKWPYRRPRH